MYGGQCIAIGVARCLLSCLVCADSQSSQLSQLQLYVSSGAIGQQSTNAKKDRKSKDKTETATPTATLVAVYRLQLYRLQGT